MEAVAKFNPWDYSLKTFAGKLLSWSLDAYKELTSVRADKQCDSGKPETPPVNATEAPSHCYPNCDLGIWLRTCDVEVNTPLEGDTSGHIPLWIDGALYRNGPGKQRYGKQSVNHLFDAAGLVHW